MFYIPFEQKMNKVKIDKSIWKKAIGAKSKARRLKITADINGMFECPVPCCDHRNFNAKRGCRKHVYNIHGWFYFFDTKPDIKKVLPEVNTRVSKITLPKRCQTVNMPMFLKTCTIGKSFQIWISSPGGGGKSFTQAGQLLCKILKYFKFCCEDVATSWDIPDTVVDFCLGSVTMVSDFVEYLQNEWKVGYSGIIGYMNAIGHMLDFRRSVNETNGAKYIATEIYLQRVKRYLFKKMKTSWNELLSIEYLNSINCWATLKDLQLVIPYHCNKYMQIVKNASITLNNVPAHDLSFCTSFITAMLFLMVKASRPMTFKFLTVQMIKNTDKKGIIDQTRFKTQEKYGFDSLIFSNEVLRLVNGYIEYIRPRLNPDCDFLLICRNGKQLENLSNVFRRIVYQAIGKYINPTRYRQIIETESAMNLNQDEQAAVSADQKHSSHVAKIHYQKIQSHEIATKGQQCVQKLASNIEASNSILKVNDAVENITNDFTREVDIAQETQSKKAPFSSMEDQFLIDGMKKYGSGKWTSILNDPGYKFHPSRSVSTLAVRSKQKKFKTITKS